MTTIAIPYPDKILRESYKTVEFIEISSNLGDTYKQVAPKGLNPVRDIWNIIWKGLTSAEKEILETQLRSVGTWGTLLWTPCYETVEQQFRIDKRGYTVKHIGGNNIFSVSCKLEQHFDILD